MMDKANSLAIGVQASDEVQVYFMTATGEMQVNPSVGATGLQFDVNRSWPAFVLAGALLCGNCFAGTEASHPDPLAVIVPSMERAQTNVQLPGQITREYHVNTPSSISDDSGVIAEMDFAPPARYVIQKRYGSYRAELVVKHVLQHELEISASSQKLQAAGITRLNYDFQFLGDDNLEGHTCYILQLIPKRGQPELIRGRVWVDQQSFLIRRIEGDLAKSPSWWVKAAHVDIRFSEFRGMWLQTSWNAVADVRCFGPQELSSKVLDYSAAPAVARTPRHATPAFATATR
jgi:hypothetical protein